jgi:hypothetical protein
MGWRLISFAFGSSGPVAAEHHWSGVIHLRRRLVKRATQWTGIITKALIFFNALLKSLPQIHMDHAFSAIGCFGLIGHGGLLGKGITITRSFCQVLILINLQGAEPGVSSSSRH